MQDEKHPISGPSEVDPAELVRRYRQSGVRSGSRRNSSRRTKGASRTAPVTPPSPGHAGRLDSGERRSRGKRRGTRRNRRITRRRRISAIRHTLVNIGYLAIAGLIAYIVLKGIMKEGTW